MPIKWIWIGIAAYTIIAGVTAYLSRTERSKNMSHYFLGDRKMGGFVSALSYSATTYSAFMLIGLAGLTYSGGVGALGFELIIFSGERAVLFLGPAFGPSGSNPG